MHRHAHDCDFDVASLLRFGGCPETASSRIPDSTGALAICPGGLVSEEPHQSSVGDGIGNSLVR